MRHKWTFRKCPEFRKSSEFASACSLLTVQDGPQRPDLHPEGTPVEAAETGGWWGGGGWRGHPSNLRPLQQRVDMEESHITDVHASLL